MKLTELLELGDRELVALVGGGGKSTLLFALGDELAAAGNRVVLTTTTKMGREQVDAATTVCWSADPECVTVALDQGSPVMAVTGGDDHKVTGPDPDVVDLVFAQSGASYVVVEADGSRGKPLKAPAAHEPVIPGSTTLVVILMGVDAVGARLSAVTHRVEQAIAFSGRDAERILSAEDCARIITHPDGALRSCPDDARVLVGLTKVDAATEQAAADLQRALETHPRIHRVVVIPEPPRTQIRRIRGDEGVALRDVRLRSLADSPDSFGSTHQAASARPDSYWADWAKRASAGNGECLFVAASGSDLVGLIGAFTIEHRPSDRHVIAMWVEPEARREGIATRLVAAVIEWCRSGGAARAGLWVVDGNDAARRLYERAGFEATGRTQSLPSNPELVEHLMILDIESAN